MTDKPSKSEEEYFARKEAELREARRLAAQAAERNAERKSHFMKCPKCGADLFVEEYHGVEIDRCPDCRGIWFDAGEAELLIEKETAGFGKIFASVVKGVRGRASASG